MRTNYQQQKTLDWFLELGYRSPTYCERVPLTTGCLLVRMPGKWKREISLVINTDGSYRAASMDAYA